jgi:hypothetical protein
VQSLRADAEHATHTRGAITKRDRSICTTRLIGVSTVAISCPRKESQKAVALDVLTTGVITARLKRDQKSIGNMEANELVISLIERALRDGQDVIFLTYEQCMIMVNGKLTSGFSQANDSKVYRWQLKDFGQRMIFAETNAIDGPTRECSGKTTERSKKYWQEMK